MEWTKKSIRRLRFDLGNMSQENFGKKLGVALGTVWRWEKGKTSPEPPMIKKLDRLALKAEPSYPAGC